MQDAAAESGAPANEQLREILHQAQQSLTRIETEMAAAVRDRAELITYLADPPPCAAAAIEAAADAITTRITILADIHAAILAQTAAITRAALTAATLTLVGPPEPPPAAAPGARHRRARGGTSTGSQRDTSSHLRLLGLSPLVEWARYLSHGGAPWTGVAAVAIAGSLAQAVPMPDSPVHSQARTAVHRDDVSPTTASRIPPPGLSRRGWPSAPPRTATMSGQPVTTPEVPGSAGTAPQRPSAPPPRPSPQAPPVTVTVAPGTLLLGSPSLDLGTGITGSVTLTAAGGPVTWSADSVPAGITLSSYGGTLAAGQTTPLTITITATAAILPGTATLTLDPGQELSLSWLGVPVLPGL